MNQAERVPFCLAVTSTRPKNASGSDLYLESARLSPAGTRCKEGFRTASALLSRGRIATSLSQNPECKAPRTSSHDCAAVAVRAGEGIAGRQPTIASAAETERRRSSLHLPRWTTGGKAITLRQTADSESEPERGEGEGHGKENSGEGGGVEPAGGSGEDDQLGGGGGSSGGGAGEKNNDPPSDPEHPAKEEEDEESAAEADFVPNDEL